MRRSDYDLVKVSFEQEYPEDDQSCFLSSGDAVLDLLSINEMMQKLGEPSSIDRGIKIYKEKQKGSSYVVAGDPAEGTGGDYSAAVILDIESLEIVAVYQGHLKPPEFAAKLVEMCNLYKFPGQYPPLLAVERNNHGHAVLLALNEMLNYSNIYQHSDEKLGFRTDGISRPLMIDKFIEAFDGGHLKIYDKAILAECLTLINNNGKIEASSGKHDDLIIACSIALQVKPDTKFLHTDLESLIKL